MTEPAISFVVPVRNDAARLRLCLEAILKAVVASGEVEVIVADNGSTDDSKEMAEAAGARVLDLPGLNVAELRNRAVAQSHGGLLAFCDADNLIGRDWIAVAEELLEDSDVAAAGAPCRPPTPSNWVQDAYDGLRDHSSGTRSTRWLGAGNMVIRRSAFLELGGFDESLTACEDVDLCNRLRRSGWTILNDSRLFNVHLGDPETLRQVFTGEMWRGQDNIRVSLRGFSSWKDLISILFPLSSLGLLATGALGILAAPIGGSWVAVSALVGFGGLCSVRAGSMLGRSRRLSWRHFHKAFLVAATYELARALALVWKTDHHRSRQR